SLLQSDLKARIRVVAAGKLVTSARAAWALCVGADFVNTAREHVRIVQTANQGIALNVLYPYPTAGSRAAAKQASSATGMAA
ncbi:MAG: glutamate synthase-related protein, partial [Betaproteobacteria bacterium]|nr:glutamate synthase-related protein [Betaproteobacteria bacterium]